MSHHDIEKAGIEDTTRPQALNGGHAAPVPRPTRIGNPATLGLFSFASTTLILSLFNAQTRGVHVANAVVGMACFCGGLAQLLAGMWEFPRGNTFGGAAFSSYGAFWMSYATILIPGSGIINAYESVEGGAEQLSSALGIYLITWMLVTFFFFIASLRKAIAFIALFGFLTVTFACLAGGEFAGSVASTKAGGILGCITALIAYYIGLADMLAAEDQAIATLPLGVFAKKIN
ncbi:hypothetical protein D9756_007157 [Leucocoprinus leucothites]|uniref:Gpr1 family protein n=1 Tax=Leucocoprinus leucothites TaxID=201217 RepID=A0A8H5FZ02_9AGAR|nr:hypothetical protein D9756_007157 [Leucoagaricus leucothites]